MNLVDPSGQLGHFAVGALVGAAVGAVTYALTTDSECWTLGGFAGATFGGAVAGAIMAFAPWLLSTLGAEAAGLMIAAPWFGHALGAVAGVANYGIAATLDPHREITTAGVLLSAGVGAVAGISSMGAGGIAGLASGGSRAATVTTSGSVRAFHSYGKTKIAQDAGIE